MKNLKIVILCVGFTLLGFEIANHFKFNDFFYSDDAKVPAIQIAKCEPQIVKEVVEVSKECVPVIKEINVCSHRSHKSKDFEQKDATLSAVVDSKVSYSSNNNEDPTDSIIFMTGSYGYNGSIGFTQVGSVGYAFPNKSVSLGLQYNQRIYNSFWGYAGINLRGDTSVGLGYKLK